MRLCQVALSVRSASLEETKQWYIDGLGFADAGGLSFSGAEMAVFQGIDAPTIDYDLAFLVGRTGFMNVELFSYRTPTPAPRRPDWSPSDVGYSLFSIHVLDFDGTLRRLEALGTTPLTAPVGPPGDRRVCVADPNGCMVELWERDLAWEDVPEPVRPDANPAVRGVRATVLDPDRARRFLTEAIGLRPAATPAHGPDHEALWGAPDTPELLTLTDGQHFVEIATYASGMRDWPEGYQLSDEGILNVAYGTDDKADYLAAVGRIEDGPYPKSGPRLALDGDLDVIYALDEQNFSVELLYLDPSQYDRYGFAPPSLAATTPPTAES